MTSNEFVQMLIIAATEIINAEDELTQIDAKFGDADHGITMTKIMKNIIQEIECMNKDKTFKEILDDISMAIMSINGGSAVPLWSTLFDGMSSGAVDDTIMNEDQFKEMFKSGYEELQELSKAKVGDKTMMDTLIPAVNTICTTNGDIRYIISEATKSAIKGSKDSENYIAKFGRAKSYKEKTIGTEDAGATSMKYFFIGLNKYFN